MNFCSDNVSGTSVEILDALSRANRGPAMPYGDDELSKNVMAIIKELFEAEVEVLFMPTGTAANALALATMTPPFGSIYCHPNSHVNVDECGAPEFFTGGAKLSLVPGENGKISPDALETMITGAGIVHHTQPASVSVSQVTEAGTIYSIAELEAVSDVCRRHSLKLHMDGARFANAVEALECNPADISHRVGVDVLSFGATKNGALCAEAVVFFDLELAKKAGYQRKRAGHLFSKMRFLSAQFGAYLKDDLWRQNAKHANEMADRLKRSLGKLGCASFEYPVQANEVFVRLPLPIIEELLAEGFMFYRWEPEGTLIRMITAFDTNPEDVDLFIRTVRKLAA